MNYNELAAENKAWALKNFGDKSNAENSYFGMVEELGELAHIILKERQGIREGRLPKEQRKALKADAIADCAIYLLNWYGFGLETRPKRAPLQLLNLNEIAKDWTEFDLMELAMKCMKDLPCYDNHCWLLTVLDEFANMYDINFEQNLLETWNRVKSRDFTLYPENGVDK